MPRTDDDTWTITQSVGATALGVAAARATETERDHPLISDPFARLFLDRAGPGSWSIYDAQLTPADRDADPDVGATVAAMVDYLAVRTVFFDEFFHSATGGGLRQVVILAAGLDARAWRLPWPDGTVVYELDRPEVLDFKAEALRPHAARPAADLVNVPVDLRQDWPGALRAAGFDPSRPTAWSAEGLLRYLTAADQDRLVDRIHEFSAPGSWLAVNAVSAEAIDPDHLARQRDRLRAAAAQLAGPIDRGTEDPAELWYLEQRTDIREQLGGHGWHVATTTLRELLARLDRNADADALIPSFFVSAQLNWP